MSQVLVFRGRQNNAERVFIAPTHKEIAKEMMQYLFERREHGHNHTGREDAIGRFRGREAEAARILRRLLNEGILICDHPNARKPYVRINQAMMEQARVIARGGAKALTPRQTTEFENPVAVAVPAIEAMRDEIRVDAIEADVGGNGQAKVAFEKLSDEDIMDLFRSGATVAEVKSLFPKAQKGKSLDGRLRKIASGMIKREEREERWLKAAIERDQEAAKAAATKEYIDAEFGVGAERKRFARLRGLVNSVLRR